MTTPRWINRTTKCIIVHSSCRSFIHLSSILCQAPRRPRTCHLIKFVRNNLLSLAHVLLIILQFLTQTHLLPHHSVSYDEVRRICHPRHPSLACLQHTKTESLPLWGHALEYTNTFFGEIGFREVDQHHRPCMVESTMRIRFISWLGGFFLGNLLSSTSSLFRNSLPGR